MANIASMISMPEYSPKCESLFENLFTPAYEKTDSELVCEIVGPESPWYTDIFSYLHHKTSPMDFSTNQRKIFICCLVLICDFFNEQLRVPKDKKAFDIPSDSLKNPFYQSFIPNYVVFARE